jgi:membrane associated rhomboid family serine protease
MSAWSLGAVPRDSVRDLRQPTSGLKTFVDKVVKWIPGDVLGLYLAAVSAIGVASPQLWLLIVAIVLAPFVVVFGSLTLPENQRPSRLPARAALSAVAVAIWALTVPGSGWQVFAAVSQNAQTVAVIGAILGLVFGLVASVLVPDEA